MLDFAQLMQEATASSEIISNNAVSGILKIQEGTQIAEDKAVSARETASAAERIATIELQDKARQENERKQVAARIGTDPSQIGWAIGAYADRIKKADAILAAENEQIRQIDSIGFLENPIGYLEGQMRVNNHIANYNAAARDRNNAENAAAALDKLTTDSFKTVNALSSTVSEAYIAAAKVVQAHQYNAQASDASLQAVRLNLEGIRLASEATRDRLSVLFQANSAEMQQKSYALALENLGMEKARYNLAKAAHDEKTSEDSLILKYVQSGYFARTGKQMDPARSKEIVTLYRAKNPDIVSMFESGLESAMVGKPMISSSAFDVSTLHATGKIQNLPLAQREVADQLVTWRREFESPAVQNALQIDKKDKTAVERAFNSYVQQQIGTGNSTVFKPMPLTQTAANSKLVANMPVWKNVLEPAKNAGVNIDEPNTAFSVILGAMKEGKLSYPDALDYSVALQAGLDINNQARNFLTFGMQPQRTFNAAVSLPMSIGKTSANLTDQRAFATLLNKALASEAIKSHLTVNTPQGVMFNLGTNPSAFTDPLGKALSSVPLQYGPKLLVDSAGRPINQGAQ